MKFQKTSIVYKFLKKIFPATYSKAIITFASLITISQVATATNLSPTSLVPSRPFTPHLPKQTANEIVKADKFISF